MRDQPITVHHSWKPQEKGEPHPGYVSIDNAPLQDKRLSFRARGILAYVLSKHPTWTYAADRIANDGKEGRDAVGMALNELRRLGYADCRRIRNTEGKIVTRWEFWELPRPENPVSVSSPPRPEKPVSGPNTPRPEKPRPEKSAPGKSGPFEMISEERTEKKTPDNLPPPPPVESKLQSRPPPRTLAEVEEVATQHRLGPGIAEAFWAVQTGRDWKHPNGRPIRDVEKALLSFARSKDGKFAEKAWLFNHRQNQTNQTLNARAS